MVVEIGKYYITDNGCIHILGGNESTCTFEEVKLTYGGEIRFQPDATDYRRIFEPHVIKETDDKLFKELCNLCGIYENTTNLFEELIKY